jgi:hypothetical protein
MREIPGKHRLRGCDGHARLDKETAPGGEHRKEEAEPAPVVTQSVQKLDSPTALMIIFFNAQSTVSKIDELDCKASEKNLHV